MRRVFVRRRDVRWSVLFDFPVFPGFPGKVVYEEEIEAIDKETALRTAQENFMEKARWIEANKWKSFGGYVESVTPVAVREGA